MRRLKHRLIEAMCDRYPEELTVIDTRLIAIRDSMCGGPPLVGSAVDVVTVSAGEIRCATTEWPPTTFPECMRAERETWSRVWDKHVAETFRREVDVRGGGNDPEPACGDCEDRTGAAEAVEQAGGTDQEADQP